MATAGSSLSAAASSPDSEEKVKQDMVHLERERESCEEWKTGMNLELSCHASQSG